MSDSIPSPSPRAAGSSASADASQAAPLPREVLQGIVEGIPYAACIVAGARIVAANALFTGQVGATVAELCAQPDIFSFFTEADAARLRQRYAARMRGEAVPDEYEFAGLNAAARQPSRARISAFPLAGEGAVLFLSRTERDRDRSARLIRGLVDAAIAVQNERSLTGIFVVARERLSAMGLTVAFAEIAGARFRFLLPVPADGPLSLAAASLEERYPVWCPLDAFPLLQAASKNAQGVLVEDAAELLSQLLGTSRAEARIDAALCAVAAGIPVDGSVAFVVAGCGPALDSTVASAFGLFGKQLGAAVETTRRLDDLARSNRELMTVNHVARASATLASGLALKEAIERLALSVAIDSVALFRREEDQLVLAVQQGFPDEWAAEASRVPLGQGTPWGEAAASGEPVVFEIGTGRVWHSARRVPTPPGGLPPIFSAERGAPEEIADSIAVPLQVSDDVNGVLVASRPGAPLTRDDLRLLTTVAAQLAVSLQNALLFQQTQRRISELSLLLELGQAVASSLDTREVLAAGARVAARVLRCSAAWVLVPDAQRTKLVAAAAEDPELGRRLDIQIPLERASLSALAFETGKAQKSAHAALDPRIDPELTALFQCRATLAVPLLSRDRPIGVLLLVERTVDRAFDAQDTRLASHAAQLLATSIQNAHLFASERQRAQEMALLNEVSRSLAGSLELKPLLESAAETVRKLLDASNCFVMLKDEKRHELRCFVSPPRHAAFMEKVVLPLDGPSLSARAIRERRTMQVQEPTDSPLVDGRVSRELGERSLMTVPLFARDEALGTLVLDDVREPRVFTAAEVERATAVAGQVALAVLSARLYEDLRASYAQLARAQTDLIDRERLAMLGELSASIAHEVRNPLGVIFNSLHSLKKLLRPEGDVKLLLDIVREESDRLNRMVGDLLDYSRPLQPALSPVHLKALVRDALLAARPPPESAPAGPLSAEVEVKLTIPDDLHVRADQRLLRQALINLFLNAYQAMPRGGVLRISASRPELSDASGEGLAQTRIVIQDTGPGIPPTVRDDVFKPFFTTKATGTGLGLAVVKRIIDGHGGSIEVGDRERGAEFRVRLPLDATP